MAFIKTDGHGTRQLCERYRDPQTGKPRLKVLVSFGRFESPHAALAALKQERIELRGHLRHFQAEAIKGRTVNRHEWTCAERRLLHVESDIQRIAAAIKRYELESAKNHRPNKTQDD